MLNNWGYSKLTRGDYREAERLFGEAIRRIHRHESVSALFENH